MKNIKWHLLVWIVYFLIVYISDLILNPSITFIVEVTIFLTHNIYLFYSLLFVIRKFSVRRKYLAVISISRFILVIVVFFCFKYIIIYFLLPRVYEQLIEPQESQWITVGFLWVINYSLFASAYFYFISSLQKQKVVNSLVQEKAAKEQERLQLENIALRAQINPHFLYNTLGFLYAEALPHSDKLSEGIMRLSEIMQYSIKPHDASGMVLLEDEIEHIENVLEINKLRFGQSIYVHFTYEGQRSGVRIVPLVLLTLVENVLKHGQLNDPECVATIHLQLDGTKLTFTTHNKKRSGPKERSTSIGLNNTRKRLQNAYGQNFSLTSKDEEEYFTTTLMIDNIRQPATKAVA